MEFRILGPLEVADGGTTRDLGGPRHRTLLALLLMHVGEVVATERLIEALWGDETPRNATAMLHVRIAELRRMLGGGRGGRHQLLRTRRPGYILELDVDALDANRFERLAAEGRQMLAAGDAWAAAQRLRSALALWRGPAFADVADYPFAQPTVARLEELRLLALEVCLDADLALGRHAEVIAESESLVAEHPLRERFWSQHILALYRAGRQGDALQAYRVARDRLVEELGIEPGEELRRLEAAILRQDPALAPPDLAAGHRPAEPQSNLPTRLTSFVGRELELDELHTLLAANRLVTITGAGGVGKSRIALEAAAAQAALHADGIWLVELVPVTEAGMVASAVAAVLRVREQPERPLADVLVEHLRTTEALLLLDNCEHLLKPVAMFAERLLAGCPRLRILATSRERLGVPGEVLRPLPGLRLPDQGATDAAAVGRADATQLFVQRATAVQPGFRLSEATAAAVAQLCRRLDGLPLAIELAATRVSALGVEQIAVRLDDRFRLLTNGSRAALPRHQTLKAVVDWSYELLADPERRLFDRIAVFVGGFTLEAAEVVCGPHPGERGPLVPQLLAHLVDKSLVTAEAAEASTYRYRLLETLRAYALERLAERGETVVMQARHADWFRALAEAGGAGFQGPEQAAWLDRLEADHGNLRAALEWSLETDDAETALAITGSLFQFWDVRGHYNEGRRWLTHALAMQGTVRPATRARALVGAAQLAMIQGELEQATAASEEAVRLCRAADDTAVLAHALQYMGFLAVFADQLDQAEAVLAESLEAARATSVAYLEGWSLLFLATVALARDNHARAVGLAGECQAVLDSVGDQEGRAWTLTIRAAALRRSDPIKAGRFLRAGLEAFQVIGGLWGLSLCLFVAAQLAAVHAEPGRAATLLGASEALRESVGAATMPFVQRWMNELTAEVTVALGAEAFKRTLQRGWTLSSDEAIAEALRGLDWIVAPRANERSEEPPSSPC